MFLAPCVPSIEAASSPLAGLVMPIQWTAESPYQKGRVEEGVVGCAPPAARWTRDARDGKNALVLVTHNTKTKKRGRGNKP